jgi:hypothetical protein
MFPVFCGISGWWRTTWRAGEDLAVRFEERRERSEGRDPASGGRQPPVECEPDRSVDLIEDRGRIKRGEFPHAGATRGGVP